MIQKAGGVCCGVYKKGVNNGSLFQHGISVMGVDNSAAYGYDTCEDSDEQ
jgi:hypothetical protein